MAEVRTVTLKLTEVELIDLKRVVHEAARTDDNPTLNDLAEKVGELQWWEAKTKWDDNDD